MQVQRESCFEGEQLGRHGTEDHDDFSSVLPSRTLPLLARLDSL